MRRVLLLTAIVVFFVWRGRRLDAFDRRHGYGAYAAVIPTLLSGAHAGRRHR